MMTLCIDAMRKFEPWTCKSNEASAPNRIKIKVNGIVHHKINDGFIGAFIANYNFDLFFIYSFTTPTLF